MSPDPCILGFFAGNAESSDGAHGAPYGSHESGFARPWGEISWIWPALMVVSLAWIMAVYAG